MMEFSEVSDEVITTEEEEIPEATETVTEE